MSLADFQRVAQAGVSHIRLPVAYHYWDVEAGEPFPASNMDENDEYSPLYYIKQAFSWAAQTGLKVNHLTISCVLLCDTLVNRLKLMYILVRDLRIPLTTAAAEEIMSLTFTGAVMKVRADTT